MFADQIWGNSRSSYNNKLSFLNIYMHSIVFLKKIFFVSWELMWTRYIYLLIPLLKESFNEYLSISYMNQALCLAPGRQKEEYRQYLFIHRVFRPVGKTNDNNVIYKKCIFDHSNDQNIFHIFFCHGSWFTSGSYFPKAMEFPEW